MGATSAGWCELETRVRGLARFDMFGDITADPKTD